MKKLTFLTLASFLIPLAAHALVLAPRGFTDVSPSAWYAPFVSQASTLHIVSGYKNADGTWTGKFGPNNNITIAEALKIAIQGAGYNIADYAALDMPQVHWWDVYTETAVELNFSSVFRTDNQMNRPATRAEVAQLFAEAFKVDGAATLGTQFNDVTAQTNYAYTIQALSNDGVVSGDTDAEGNALARFRPSDPINRAEVVKMIMKARETYGATTNTESSSLRGLNDWMMVPQYDATVIYTDAGFEPNVVSIKTIPASILFKNNSSNEVWIASDPHPTHTDHPEFSNEKPLNRGLTTVVSFEKKGTYKYHNHLNPSQTGTITVGE